MGRNMSQKLEGTSLLVNCELFEHGRGQVYACCMHIIQKVPGITRAILMIAKNVENSYSMTLHFLRIIESSEQERNMTTCQ